MSYNGTPLNYSTYARRNSILDLKISDGIAPPNCYIILFGRMALQWSFVANGPSANPPKDIAYLRKFATFGLVPIFQPHRFVPLHVYGRYLRPDS